MTKVLPQRIRAGCDVAYCVCCLYCAMFCHSAFARVATLLIVCVVCIVLCFATAHSRGLRLLVSNGNAKITILPQRIRAGCDLRTAKAAHPQMRFCHSAFARVATSRSCC